MPMLTQLNKRSALWHANSLLYHLSGPFMRLQSFIEVDASGLVDHREGANHEADDQCEAQHDQLHSRI